MWDWRGQGGGNYGNWIFGDLGERRSRGACAVYCRAGNIGWYCKIGKVLSGVGRCAGPLAISVLTILTLKIFTQPSLFPDRYLQSLQTSLLESCDAKQGNRILATASVFSQVVQVVQVWMPGIFWHRPKKGFSNVFPSFFHWPKTCQSFFKFFAYFGQACYCADPKHAKCFFQMF